MATSNLTSFSNSTNPTDTNIFDSLLPVLNVTQYWLVFSFQCVALTLLCNLLVLATFCKAEGARKIPKLMRLFLFFHAILLVLSIPAVTQKIFTLFNPFTHFEVVFWLYAVGGCYNYIQPFLALFLMVERILIVRFPMGFSRRKQQAYLYSVAILTPLLFLLVLCCYMAELPLDQATALACAPQICIGPKYKYYAQTAIKVTLGITHLLCSILFFRWLSKEMGKRIKFRVVKFTIICEICFDIIPAFINLTVTKLTGATLSRYIGGLVATMVGADVTACAIFYSVIFLVVVRRQNTPTTVNIGWIGGENNHRTAASVAPNSSSMMTARPRNQK